jgi:hypothetical protein
MRPTKILFLILSLGFALTCSARDYSLKGAMHAASKKIPKGSPEKFAFFDVSDTRGTKEQLLDFFRAGMGSKVFFAVAAPKNELIRDLLIGAMKMAEKEKFKGLNLIIVGDRIEPEMFDPLLKDRGISVSYAAYE